MDRRRGRASEIPPQSPDLIPIDYYLLRCVIKDTVRVYYEQALGQFLDERFDVTAVGRHNTLR